MTTDSADLYFRRVTATRNEPVSLAQGMFPATAGDLPLWAIETAPQVSALTRLPHNWNGYNSVPPSKETAARAIRLLTLIGSHAQHPPLVSATGDQSILLEWHRGNDYLAIEVPAPQLPMSYFALTASGETEADLPEDSLGQVLGQFFGH